MFLSKTRTVLLSVLTSSAVVGLLGLSALPASAASAVSANGGATPNAIGSVVCSGDLCIQTQSVNTSACTAVVNAWANTTTIRSGHFEIIPVSPVASHGVNSSGGDRTWPAGGTHASITIPFFGSPESYQAIAWRHNSNGSYTKVGVVNFTINVPSFC